MSFLQRAIAEARLESDDVPRYTPRARRSLAGALSLPGTRIVAEIKRASPSAGTLDMSIDAPARARAFERSRAAAISVLTSPLFHGSLADLEHVSRVARVPVLRKDFLVKPSQIARAKAAGADAVLLIVRALDRSSLEDLLRVARDLDLESVVEVHDERELDVALAANAEIVGINHRNLDTLAIDRTTSSRLLPRIPSDRIALVCSGVRGREDLREGRCFLVGEALSRKPDLLAELVS